MTESDPKSSAPACETGLSSSEPHAWMRYARVETGFELAQDFDELREGISRLESLLAELSEEAAP